MTPAGWFLFFLFLVFAAIAYPFCESLAIGFVVADALILVLWGEKCVRGWVDRRINKRQMVDNELFGDSKKLTAGQLYIDKRGKL